MEHVLFLPHNVQCRATVRHISQQEASERHCCANAHLLGLSTQHVLVNGPDGTIHDFPPLGVQFGDLEDVFKPVFPIMASSAPQVDVILSVVTNEMRPATVSSTWKNYGNYGSSNGGPM